MDLDQALEYAKAVGLTDAQLAGAVKAAADDVRFRQIAADEVVMTHPDLEGQEITVNAAAVEQHEASGWVVKPAEPEPDAEAPAEPAEQPAEPAKEPKP
jgi:hypothetical protein